MAHCIKINCKLLPLWDVAATLYDIILTRGYPLGPQMPLWMTKKIKGSSLGAVAATLADMIYVRFSSFSM